MVIHEMILTDEEVLALREATSEEVARLRRYISDGFRATEKTHRRLAVLEALLDNFKDLTFK